MPSAPNPSPYRPETPILDLAGWLGDEVAPAPFPETTLRFRNDRWAQAVGLDSFSDEEWLKHFGSFAPLADNLLIPLALRYHGHQFRVYNPDLGDGRGFLFAQMRDGDERLLDLGTKGSGQTPWSRAGDGRLTLKGGVREILATEMLEALGVNTSKTFSIVETGEELVRGDEPSPTRSAVMTRLSHGHIRIGTFQRLLALEESAHMEQLVDYCLTQFPGPPPPEDASDREDPAVRLLHQVVERLADRLMSKDVIWRCGLLNPKWLELSELGHPINGLANFPALIGIGHQKSIWPDCLTHDSTTTFVIIDILPNLDLESDLLERVKDLQYTISLEGLEHCQVPAENYDDVIKGLRQEGA